jgi:uncharacterized membrane protein YkvA (DUF1232 family)
MDFNPEDFASPEDLDEKAAEAKLGAPPPKNNVAMALWNDARLVWAAIRNDQVTPAGYAAAAVALAYFVCPVDFMPDIIPIAGYGDDLMVVRWALGQIAKR